jgi:hypothetical protein
MRVVYTIAWAALAATMIAAAYLQIFSIYMVYDDEGYVLMSLVNFAKYGALYDKVYSQYGPLFYLIFGGLARIADFTWTHDLGRFFTLFNWVGSALICGWITVRLSRSMVTGLLAATGVFAHLWQMTAEPMHPGGTLTLWTTLGVALSLNAVLMDRPKRFAVIVGITATACALVKINVGVFFAAAAFMWMWFNRPPHWKIHASLDGIVIAGAAIGPTVLMRGMLHESWASIYAFAGGVALASVGMLAYRHATPSMIKTAWLSGTLAAAGVLVGTLGGALATGTSGHGLLDGVLLGPLRHADAYHFGFNWRTGTIPATILSAALAFLCFRRRSGEPLGPQTTKLLAFARIGAGAFFLIHCFRPETGTTGLVMTSLAATTWWMAYSITPTAPAINRGRIWLGLVLVWQFLHAYPVAGSQVGWGTLLWIPLAATAVHESVLGITASWRERSELLVKVSRTGIGITTGFLMLGQFKMGLIFFEPTAPLGLPGAAHLRVPPITGSAIRIMTRNAQLHSDDLFSLPGSYSFNLWSKLPTPNLTNATHWFALLDFPQQKSIEDHLRNTPRTSIIVQPQLAFAYLQLESDSSSPLLDYIKQDYAPLFDLDPFAFWGRKRSSFAILDRAERFVRADSVNSSEPLAYRVSINTLLPPHEKIAAVAIAIFEGQGIRQEPAWTWHAGNTYVESLEINPDGSPRSEPTPKAVNWPITAQGLTELHFYPQVQLPKVSDFRIWFKFLNPDGELIGEARFIHDYMDPQP